MKKITKVCLSLLMLLSVFFVVQPIDADAAYKSTTVSGYKTYIRSGRFPGGFTMKLIYSEVYSDFGATTWRLTKMDSYSTGTDEYLSIRNDVSTRTYVNGASKDVVTGFSWCSSFVSDPSNITFCYNKSGGYLLDKGNSYTRHVSNFVLSTSYYPSIHTLTGYLYY